jgi:hypothetical protein
MTSATKHLLKTSIRFGLCVGASVYGLHWIRIHGIMNGSWSMNSTYGQKYENSSLFFLLPIVATVLLIPDLLSAIHGWRYERWARKNRRIRGVKNEPPAN